MQTAVNGDLGLALLGAWRRRELLASAGWALPDPAGIGNAQEAVVAALDGQTLPGFWKSGGPRREAASLSHAPLPRAGVRQVQGATSMDFSDLWLPACGIEAEIALRLGRDVSPALAAGLDQAAATALVDGMAVAVELTASRWREADAAPEPLRQADLLSHGALLLGPWLAPAARDWAGQTCWVEIEGQPRLQRRGSHALGDPCWLLPHWLRHATRHGQTLRAGSVVTTGSWTGTLPLSPGRVARVGFEGLGELRLRT
ncbi:fumarylacetoacetate hydrolase family protein [Paucibacter sediminis]|uniref:Fumarylacetoacetate hydrolase family protein n=1 Tax=Paucibacter sediminis TaxID=3019553 RepID=A0AA95SLV9_9BURK|nr:fumarylacetoacetate hydrolase family protein [Paucibacter sp. S2-9]WIT10717.1 fumarylacetoacetate hydrolase family protein [Paucibacter sp. S2-9]